MFTYINENFLHAPSTDLSRDTVKTLIQIMLAQGQEVFLEKQIADGKKVGLLAKLASQASYLYAQAVEGTQENVNKAIFEKVWLLVVQVCFNRPLIAPACISKKNLGRIRIFTLEHQSFRGGFLTDDHHRSNQTTWPR